MKLLTRRILGVLPIVGCGAGLSTLALTWRSSPHDAATIAVLAAFAAAYVVGAVAGWMLLEGRRRATAANFFYWLIQVPQFTTFPLAYGFWTPLSVIAWLNPASSGGVFSAHLGSTHRFSVFNAGNDWAIGLNLFAALCCALLYFGYRRDRGRMAMDIDDDAIRAALEAEKTGFGRLRLEPGEYQPAFAPPISAS